MVNLRVDVSEETLARFERLAELTHSDIEELHRTALERFLNDEIDGLARSVDAGADSVDGRKIDIVAVRTWLDSIDSTPHDPSLPVIVEPSRPLKRAS